MRLGVSGETEYLGRNPKPVAQNCEKKYCGEAEVTLSRNNTLEEKGAYRVMLSEFFLEARDGSRNGLRVISKSGRGIGF